MSNCGKTSHPLIISPCSFNDCFIFLKLKPRPLQDPHEVPAQAAMSLRPDRQAVGPSLYPKASTSPHRCNVRRNDARSRATRCSNGPIDDEAEAVTEAAAMVAEGSPPVVATLSLLHRLQPPPSCPAHLPSRAKTVITLRRTARGRRVSGIALSL